MTIRLGRARPLMLGLLGMSAVALIVASVAGGLAQQRDASYWVAHTDEVLLRAAALELHVQAAISAGRGYRLTGDGDDVARFGQAAHEVGVDLAILRALTADSPGQQNAVGRLQLLVDARMSVVKRNMRLPGASAGSGDPVPPREAEVLTSQVTSAVHRFEAGETRLLFVRRDAVARARQRINVGMAAGGAMLSAAMLLALTLAAARARERHHMDALNALNAGLEQRVQTGTAELLAMVDALRKSEDRQREYLDNAPFAMAIMTPQPDGHYVFEYMNQACTKTYGKPRESFVGRRVDEVWPGPVAAAIQRRLANCTFVGEPFPAVIEQQVNGGWRYLDGALSPLGDSVLGRQQVLVCTRDVTEKTLLEQRVAAQVEALRQGRERERRLFEATPALLHSTGPDGALVAVSDAWLARLGYAREEVIGRQVTAFLTEESRRYHECVAMPLFSTEGAYGNLEFQAVCKSGEPVDVLVSVTSEHDAAGRILCSNAVVEDVTQRRRAERALAEERQRLSHIIEATDAATWEWNVQTGDIRFSERWVSLVGRGIDTVETLRGLCHPADLIEADSVMARHLTGRCEKYATDARMRHTSGHWVWVHSQGRIMERSVDGRPLRLFGFAMDITDRKRQEEALRRSEQFLQRTGMCAGIGGWELEVESGQFTWSPQTALIHGVPPDWRPSVAEAIAFYAPEARPTIQAAVARGIADGTGWDLELPLIRSGGERIWVRTVGNAVRTNGKIERLVGALQDITAPVSQRVALQRANERVALATACAGLGIWELDLVTGGLVCDDIMRVLFGLTAAPEAAPREWWRDRIHPDDRANVDFAALIASVETRSFQREFRVIWPDGSMRHIVATAEIVRADDGQALRIVGVDRDVTEARVLAAERDRQAAVLARTEADSRMILDNANDMISRVDAGGRRIYTSAATAALFGLSPEAFMARDFASLIHPDDLPALAALQARMRAGEVAAATMKFRVLHQDRGEIWVETAAQALSDPVTAAPAGYISVTRDVTERVRMEAEREERAREQRTLNAELERLARHMAKARTIAEQANRAKTRFLAGMSHELRTPLNGILGYAQLLRMDGGLSAVQAERVQSMLTAGTHLLEMISCVLDLSEIETAGIEVQVSPVDVVGLAEASLNIVRPAAEAKGLALSLVAAPYVPARVTTDPARLRQVLLNLLGNAIKYTPAGSVALRLSAVPPAPDAAYGTLRLEVADTGPGIPPDKAHLLFEEFERLDAATKGTAEGAGLGLSLAKRLTSVLGGALGYADNPGGGSLFWLELPLLAGESQQTSAAPARAADFTASEAETTSLSARDTLVAQVEEDTGLAVPSRVLVVDDVAMNRDIAAAFIRSAGYEVVCAEGGEQAVDMAASGDFIVVLMDVRMPGMDGLEATRRIRAAGGPRAQVPIVALTAQVFTEQIEACRAAGMDTHVAKPFTLETLLGAIARGVEAGHARDHGDGPATPLLGCDLPTLVESAFDRTAAVLLPAALGTYLGTLATRADALLRGLAGQEDPSVNAAWLADTAHALAGSAGMFGFDRLVHVARHFERAVKADATQASALAPGLKAALDASLPVMRSRAEHAAQGNIAA